MALTIRPTDGLIHRLLQQNSRTAEAPREASKSSGQVADQVNISSEARKQSSAGSASTYGTSAGYTASHKQEDLEARLLSLYSHNSENSENK